MGPTSTLYKGALFMNSENKITLSIGGRNYTLKPIDPSTILVPKPISFSEREPSRGDCNLEGEFRTALYTAHSGWLWGEWPLSEAVFAIQEGYTHWLPHNVEALPLRCYPPEELIAEFNGTRYELVPINANK